MNMQNIPSHATDIRHSFRAQPSLDQIVDCKSTEDQVSVTLFHTDKVTTSEGMKKVNDLVVGDTIKLLENNKECFLKLSSRSENIDDYGNIELVFAT